MSEPLPVSPSDRDDSPRGRLRVAVEAAAQLLPAQGPLDVFVHHNTLHALEHLPFHEALLQARRRLGAEPYLLEAEYHEARTQGRILPEDLDAVVAESTPDADRLLVGGASTLGECRRLLLAHLVREPPPAARAWLLEEDGRARRPGAEVSPEARARSARGTAAWLRAMLQEGDESRLLEALTGRASPREAARDLELRLGLQADVGALAAALDDDPEPLCAAALLAACRILVRDTPAPPTRTSPRLRDLLLARTGRDVDALVHPLLIRVTAAFLDQGQARWPMPDRQLGLLSCFRRLYGAPLGPPRPWLAGFATELAAPEAAGLDAAEQVRASLGRLGVPEAAWAAYLEASLLALPGWAGMVRTLEERPDLARLHRPTASLMDFLAVRLLLEERGLRWLLAEEFDGPADPAAARARLEQEAPPAEAEAEVIGLRLFKLAQRAGWSAPQLRALAPEARLELVAAVRALGPLERRALLHRALERRYRIQVLGALGEGAPPAPPASPPEVQFVFCLDERNESFRRHLEDALPECRTYGAAGFFGLAIYFRGLEDPSLAALCPVVVTPQHVVEERPAAGSQRAHHRWGTRRRLWARMLRSWATASSTLVRGWAATALLGLLSLFPTALHIVAPRFSQRLRARFRDLLLPPPDTDLLADESWNQRTEDGRTLGFSLPDMVERVAGQLQALGLTEGLAPLVVVLGHRSSSANNPHLSAYQCGACGGRSGAPNARLFAAFANRRDVRADLARRGIRIPAATWFVGGVHDTCSEAVEYFDLEALPPEARRHLEAVEDGLRRARAANAHERCRRFSSAPAGMDPAAALDHAEARAADLAEPRPEYNHGGNACCIVGRRDRTRGLFLDRRAFLMSYDPTRDEDAEVLGRILGAVAPVCAGINLEYYFSRVDPLRYGAGSKLPHNLSGLLGVVDGHLSDLRTGLWTQTVEVHEPLRLLLVIEATPASLDRVLDRAAPLRHLVHNEWIQLATLDPESPAIHVRGSAGWELQEPARGAQPRVSSWRSWYQASAGALPPARLEEVRRG